MVVLLFWWLVEGKWSVLLPERLVDKLGKLGKHVCCINSLVMPCLLLQVHPKLGRGVVDTSTTLCLKELQYLYKRIAQVQVREIGLGSVDWYRLTPSQVDWFVGDWVHQ